MPTYRVITQLFSQSNQLSYNECFIDAVSPAQAMRKHNLPKLNSQDQTIIVNINLVIFHKNGTMSYMPVSSNQDLHPKPNLSLPSKSKSTPKYEKTK